MSGRDRLFTLARLAVAFDVLPEGTGALPDDVAPLGEGEVDPTFEWLRDGGELLGGPNPRGFYPIVCPQCDSHTPNNDPHNDEAGYKPGRPGAFKCLHAHCQDFTTKQFREWILAEDPTARLDITDGLDLETIGARIGAVIGQGRTTAGESVRFRPPPDQAGAWQGELSPALRLAEHIRPIGLGPDILPDMTRTVAGNIALKQSTSDAKVHRVMQAIGLTARLNMMTREVEATLEGYDRVEEAEDMLGLLVHACQRCGMNDQVNIWRAATRYATARRYHPVLDWIDGVEWDGVDRIQALADTLVMRDPRREKWRNIAVRRWLIQGVVAMSNWDREAPTDVGYCLVLQGRQNIGKSKWFKNALLPPAWVTGDMSLRLDHGNERDIVKRVTMTPITELGEVNTTFKKSDTDGFKNFLTTTLDIYRAPWGMKETKWPRCTEFGATVNPEGYLIDATGERRFWTLAVARCDWQHDIDLRQLWSQVAILADSEQYWLTDAEMVLHANASRDHLTDTEAGFIVEDLDWRRQGKGEDDTWVHATARELLSHYQVKHAIQIVSELNARLERTGWARRATIRGARGWRVPAFRGKLTIGQERGIRVVAGIDLDKKD